MKLVFVSRYTQPTTRYLKPTPTHHQHTNTLPEGFFSHFFFFHLYIVKKNKNKEKKKNNKNIKYEEKS